MRKQPLRIRLRFWWARVKTRQKAWWAWSLQHPFTARSKPNFGVNQERFDKWRAGVDRHILERRERQAKHTRVPKKERRRRRRQTRQGEST